MLSIIIVAFYIYQLILIITYSQYSSTAVFVSLCSLWYLMYASELLCSGSKHFGVFHQLSENGSLLKNDLFTYRIDRVYSVFGSSRAGIIFNYLCKSNYKPQVAQGRSGRETKLLMR